jgi:hemolysin activation/secretion protein
LPFGRFVYDGLVFNRYQNYLNRQVFVGGDGRLRGYPLEAFFGKDAVASNVEFRSRSIEILSVHWGAVVFYDSADAFDGFDNLELKHSVGWGLRAAIPQAARYVFRADWGFPISPGYATFPGAIIVTFQQAFGMPQLTPPSIVSTFVESAR